MTVLGLSLSTFTEVHVVISLIGIVAGLIVLAGMLGAHRLDGWTMLFLVITVLTSVTGFLFPFTHVTPAQVVGAISLIALAVAILGRYVYDLAGSWRWLFVTGAVLALYLNFFVGVVQAFQKLPVLARLAPTQSEPPFVVVQLAVLVIFLVLGIRAVMRFRPRR